MQLLNEEIFALKITLSEQFANLDELLDGATVVERNRTGVGFFTTVKLSRLVPTEKIYSKYWEHNFQHSNMPYGGCFMVRLIGSGIFEIEAVAFESRWPEPFREKDFVY